MQFRLISDPCLPRVTVVNTAIHSPSPGKCKKGPINRFLGHHLRPHAVSNSSAPSRPPRCVHFGVSSVPTVLTTGGRDRSDLAWVAKLPDWNHYPSTGTIIFPLEPWVAKLPGKVAWAAKLPGPLTVIETIGNRRRVRQANPSEFRISAKSNSRLDVRKARPARASTTCAPSRRPLAPSS